MNGFINTRQFKYLLEKKFKYIVVVLFVLLCFPVDVEAGKIVEINLDQVEQVNGHYEGEEVSIETNKFTYEEDGNKEKNIRIKIIKNKNSYFINDYFSPAVCENLMRYLEKGPIKQPFDCNSFIHFLFGYGYVYDCNYYDNWERFWIDSEDKLSIGDVLLTCNYNDNKVERPHLALFLGNGVYLSKFGPTMPVHVTTLREIKKVYGGSILNRLVPKYSRSTCSIL